MLVYLPFAILVAALAPGGAVGLLWLWIAYTAVYLVARAVAQGLRYRGDRWLVTGS